MPNTINAQITPGSGLAYSADGSGILNLQSSGKTKLTIDSTGAFVTKDPTQPLEIATKQYVDSGGGVGGVAGVSQIIAGAGVSLSPLTGVGVVTVDVISTIPFFNTNGEEKPIALKSYPLKS
jgi:hypothetical protein